MLAVPHVLLAPLVLFGFLGIGSHQSGASDPHVRPLNPVARQLLQDGAARSSTFARLAADLEQTPLVVYVYVHDVEKGPRGSLRFISHDPWLTYLLVQVDLKQTEDERVEVLAHELQHAAEVASARFPILNGDDLRRLYRSVGYDSGEGFESRAALMAEEMVRHELVHATTRRLP